jgi:hypothetical protein
MQALREVVRCEINHGKREQEDDGKTKKEFKEAFIERIDHRNECADYGSLLSTARVPGPTEPICSRPCEA